MAVDPARWKVLFLEASDLASPAERAAYLDRQCSREPELRAQVEALLAVQGTVGLALKPEATGECEPTSPETMPGTQTVSLEAQDASRTSAPETRPPTELATAEHRPGDTRTTVEEIPPADRPGGSVAGQVIAGRYTLLDVLGEGGMGTVYLRRANPTGQAAGGAEADQGRDGLAGGAGSVRRRAAGARADGPPQHRPRLRRRHHRRPISRSS